MMIYKKGLVVERMTFGLILKLSSLFLNLRDEEQEKKR